MKKAVHSYIPCKTDDNIIVMQNEISKKQNKPQTKGLLSQNKLSRNINMQINLKSVIGATTLGNL